MGSEWGVGGFAHSFLACFGSGDGFGLPGFGVGSCAVACAVAGAFFAFAHEDVLAEGEGFWGRGLCLVWGWGRVCLAVIWSVPLSDRPSRRGL